MEVEISKFKIRFNSPFFIPTKRLYIKFYNIVNVANIFVEKVIVRDEFYIKYINPLIWKIFDMMKKSNVGYIIPYIYFHYKVWDCLPKKFLSDAIQRYGTIGDKLLCKFMFEQKYSRKFSLARLFWEFSRFDPCNDERSMGFLERYDKIYSDKIYGMFAYGDGKEGQEMRIFMWKINNINFSKNQLEEIRSIYRYKIIDLNDYEDDERIPIYREIISILDAKIAELN
jgi:hypothetical protein